MKFLQDFKEEFKKQSEKQATLNPNDPEAKKRARLGGLVITLLGLGLAVANFLSWTKVGSVTVVGLTLMLVFLVLGPYALMTGKMPKK